MSKSICKACQTSGIRLYKPMYKSDVYCHDCLVNLGGQKQYDEAIFIGELAYHPMNIRGGICFIITDFETWKQQPIRISDLYEPGSVKYQESKDKVNKFKIEKLF